MEPVDQEGDLPMGGADQVTSEQKIGILTARFDQMSTMMMEFMSDNKQKMDTIMMQMGPQGDQAREMGVIKQTLKESGEKNEARFKKLEDTVCKNKQQKEVRFEENPKNKDKKRTFEEVGESGDNDMGGASGAGSSNEGGGVLEVLGVIPRAGGLGLKGVRVLRVLRVL